MTYCCNLVVLWMSYGVALGWPCGCPQMWPWDDLVVSPGVTLCIDIPGVNLRWPCGVHKCDLGMTLCPKVVDVSRCDLVSNGLTLGLPCGCSQVRPSDAHAWPWGVWRCDLGTTLWMCQVWPSGCPQVWPCGCVLTLWSRSGYIHCSINYRLTCI